MRQNLLSVGGKNTIPPTHIVEEQQRLSSTELASQSRKIIPMEHRELCPLCHCPSFIFVQSKYSKNGLHHPSYSSPLPLHCGTFLCEQCCNQKMKLKLHQINQLKQQIQSASKLIDPILHAKMNARNTIYHDIRLKAKQRDQHISNLRLLIQQKQRENKLLKTSNDKLRIENKQRVSYLQEYESKLRHKWRAVLVDKRYEYESERNKASINKSICAQISLNKLLQISDFYAMKVLPTMHLNGHNNEARQLSMIQNIAIPSIFKTANICAFYSDPHNALFRFPVMNSIDIPPAHATAPYLNRSSSSLLKYKSSKYRVPLKRQKRRASARSIRQGSSSPLQKYIPRLTNSISSFSEKMGIPMLTPPAFSAAYRRKNESKSLPKNLDDLVLPPTFFSGDDEENKVNKLSGRGRSHSLDNIRATQRLIHSPHIEHGMCAALQYIVSFVLHAAKYLNVELLYRMALYRKSSKGQFVMHTFIQNKGKCFRLYWCGAQHSDGNILEFQHGLHLLQENINHLSIKCGVQSSKLKYFEFIANLNRLMTHLKQQQQMKKINSKAKPTKKDCKNKIEALNIINNYGSS
eukprot:222393_1